MSAFSWKNAASSVRPIVTLMLVIVFCTMVALGRTMPETFSTLVVGVVSYWFGERSKGK